MFLEDHRAVQAPWARKDSILTKETMISRSRLAVVVIKRRNMSNGVVRSAIRSTQAAESLREAFSRSSGASTVVNSGDIDYYVENLKVRPSLAVDLFSGVGFALGAASRILLPLPVCHKALMHSVDEACRRSINDDLRAMSERGDSEDADLDGEVKEALKYHRDISLSSDEASEEFAESKLVNAVTAGIHSAIRITNKV